MSLKEVRFLIYLAEILEMQETGLQTWILHPQVGLTLHFQYLCQVNKKSNLFQGHLGSIPGSGRSPGEGNGNPLQYFCLENPMDGGAWWATVHGVIKSQTWLSDFTYFTSYFAPLTLLLLLPLPFSSCHGNHERACSLHMWVCFFFLALFTNLLCFLDFTYKIVLYSICLCLTHFTWHNALQVHPCCCQCQNFVSFLWLSFCNLPRITLFFYFLVFIGG